MRAEAPVRSVERLLGAIREGRKDEVAVLVDSAPALADVRDAGGVSGVMLALYHGHLELAAWLASRRSRLDVFEAASLGDRDRVAALVEADPALASAWSPDGFQALALASFFGHLPVVRLLLERGADVNAVGRNEGKYTALTGAVTMGRADVVAELLAHGAKANYRYGAGFTPLHIAAANGRDDIVRLLLEAGADPKAQTDEGQTPRDFAAHREQHQVVALLDSE